jgi:hypothetical protein
LLLEVNNCLIGGYVELMGVIVRNVEQGLQDVHVMSCTFVFDGIHEFLPSLFADYIDLLLLSKSLCACWNFFRASIAGCDS